MQEELFDRALQRSCDGFAGCTIEGAGFVIVCDYKPFGDSGLMIELAQQLIRMRNKRVADARKAQKSSRVAGRGGFDYATFLAWMFHGTGRYVYFSPHNVSYPPWSKHATPRGLKYKPFDRLLFEIDCVLKHVQGMDREMATIAIENMVTGLDYVQYMLSGEHKGLAEQVVANARYVRAFKYGIACNMFMLHRTEPFETRGAPEWSGKRPPLERDWVDWDANGNQEDLKVWREWFVDPFQKYVEIVEGLEKEGKLSMEQVFLVVPQWCEQVNK